MVAAIRHGPPEDVRAYISYVSQWVVLALCLGLLAAWVRRVRDNQVAASASSYAAAYRLLSQLRVVSRQLSGGLDPVSLSQGLLQGLRQGVFFSRAAVYVRSEGGRLVPDGLRRGRPRRLDAGALDDDSAWADAWTSGRSPSGATARSRPATGGYSAVLPLRVGVRTIGLVGMERTEAPFTEGQLIEGTELVAEASLRLETALLFSEVRSIATAEERRRLAREIHDGIAQELASLGYAVDDLSYRATDESQREQLQELRHELTRIISELRLSIFDLRSEVQPTMGLGAALSDYARQVGADVAAHGPPRARRVTQPAAGRHRGRAAAHRPGGHHQRPQARPGAQPLGHLPDRTARGTCCVSRTTAAACVRDARTATAWRSCANVLLASVPSCTVGARADGGTVVDVVIGGGLPRPTSGGTNEGRAGAYDGAARR